jgi:hypothetical protein
MASLYLVGTSFAYRIIYIHRDDYGSIFDLFLLCCVSMQINAETIVMEQHGRKEQIAELRHSTHVHIIVHKWIVMVVSATIHTLALHHK